LKGITGITGELVGKRDGDVDRDGNWVKLLKGIMGIAGELVREGDGDIDGTWVLHGKSVGLDSVLFTPKFGL